MMTRQSLDSPANVMNHAVTELPAVLGCAGLGGILGALAPGVTQSLLTDRARYRRGFSPALVVAMAGMYGLLAWRIGLGLDLVAYGCLAAACIPLAVIDLIESRLPWPLVTPLYPLLAGVLGLAAILERQPAVLVRAALGMTVLLVFYLLIAFLSRGDLGAGDVRLAGALGLALGWRGWTVLVCGTVLSLLCAATVGAILIILGRANRQTPIPFGPALITGTFIALLIP